MGTADAEDEDEDAQHERRPHLLSADLLDELGAGDAAFDPVPSSPSPKGGERTPSETASPPRFAVPPLPGSGLAVNPWDWQSNASAGCGADRTAGRGPIMNHSIWGAGGSSPGGMSHGSLAWSGNARQGTASTAATAGMSVQCGGGGGTPAQPTEQEVARVRAHYEWQVRRQDEEISTLQQRMSRLEQRRTEAKENWNQERQSFIKEIARYGAVLSRYAIPLEEGCDATAQEGAWAVHGSTWKTEVGPAPSGGTNILATGSPTSGSLDAKLRRLNGLIVDAAQQVQQAKQPVSNGEGQLTVGPPPMGAGTIASTLQAMFPHATVRTMVGQDGAFAAAGDEVAARNEMDTPEVTGGSRKSASEESTDEALVELPPGGAADLAAELQRSTKSQIDDRALRALHALPESEALEVLRRVDDLVRAQGGRCRNLSSILQSVCRKLERRSAARGAPADGGGEDGAAAVSSTVASASATSKVVSSSRGAGAAPLIKRRGADEGEYSSGSEDGMANAQGSDEDRAKGSRRENKRNRPRRRSSRADSEDDGSGEASDDGSEAGKGNSEACEETTAARRDDTRAARREARRERRRRARAGAAGYRDGLGGDGSSDEADDWDEEEENTEIEEGTRARPKRCAREAPSSPPPSVPADLDEDASESVSRDYWTTRRIERTAQRGFEVRRRGDRWELKILMGSLDPPLSDAGMERYCKWLRNRLAAFRDEHGAQALRRCCGELNFSNNMLSNQAVWMLLECLAQYEVQAASLKMYKNRISQGGVLAICEFIRTNRRAGVVHEMHLSHNEIDDESAHELLRTLSEMKPRYPPRRPVEGAEGGTALVPVWVRLNHNRIRDPAAVLRAFESEGITSCAARNAHGCGPGRCSRVECPLAHLYLFADQAPRRRQGGWESGEANQDDGYGSGLTGPAGNPDRTGAADGEDAAAGAEGGARVRRGRRVRNRDAQDGAGGAGGGESSPYGLDTLP